MQARIDSNLYWVADDTEESILGADWHQEAITNLWNGLERVARRAELPWHVGNQLALEAWHPDGSSWRPIPDIMVHPFAGPERRKEMDAAREGIPALVVEVASPTTWRTDVETDPTARKDGAKAYEYMALGVAEYLVFDPGGEYLSGQVQAWRLRQGRTTRWLPDRRGRYNSESLGIVFAPEGLFLRIIDAEGQRVLFNHEMDEQLITLDQRAKQEARRRQEADQRGTQEAARATQEAALRQEADLRATQEAALRQEAEAEIARLRAELDRLRAGGQ